MSVGIPITDLRAYIIGATAAAAPTFVPRMLARDSADAIWVDTGTQVGSLAAGAYGGASLIPFRPAESVSPWMYVANGADYQKFSAPTSNVGASGVVQRKVGIAEPQAPPEAFLSAQLEGSFSFPTTGDVHLTGTARDLNFSANARANDVCGVVLPDPNSVGLVSIQTGGAIYQRNMRILVNGTTFFQVQDVFPAMQSGLAITSIFYFSGTTGRCVIVPANAASGPGEGEQSIYTQNLTGTLRRGSLIQVGSEICYVWSVTDGPGGSICIETSTTGAHTTADTLSGIPAIQVLGAGGGTPSFGQTITAGAFSWAVDTGVGNLEISATFPTGAGNWQPDDYFSIGFVIDNPANLTDVLFILDVGDGTFSENYYYCALRPSDLAAAYAASGTQLAAVQTIAQRAQIDADEAQAFGNQQAASSSAQTDAGDNQWVQLMIPISTLTRVGSDDSVTLQNVNGIRVRVNCLATVNVGVDSAEGLLSLGYLVGTYQPDVGDTGAPLRYRVRPRSTATGVAGNPSPATRYGVNPRRTQVTVNLPSPAYDPQIDTWDVYRFGGTVTSWRFIGSTPSTNTTFTDNYDDSVAQGGDELDFDNFEPWPTIDAPFSVQSAEVTGFIALIPLAGSPTNITRYLPGNLVRLGDNNVYTLRNRPINAGLANPNVYRFEFEENAGSQIATTAQIYEPEMARQTLPYVWGPDASGTVFGVGDPYRPGTLSFAKNYAPDSVPDSYNIEITPPSEPLLGGEILDGLSFGASTERWWALYPTPDNPTQRFNFVQTPDQRGLVAPWGHCNDGARRFWWAKDGIWSSADGSLTDDDLYDLFPHEGVPGVNVTYNGTTFFAPDYSRTETFRLEYSNGFLYAVYQDSSGIYRQLTCDLRRKAWCTDVAFSDPTGASGYVTSVYHVEQPEGSLQVGTPTLNPVLLFAVLKINAIAGTATATVANQTPLSNDLGVPIGCILATHEDPAGDMRATKQWGDYFVDCIAAAQGAALAITPVSLGAGVAPQRTLVQSLARQRTALSVGGIVTSDFLGLAFAWTDDFSQQSAETQLFVWQPSYAIQPPGAVAWKTFGGSFGLSGFFHVPQVVLAYVATQSITLTITSFDGQSPAAITLPSTGGAYQKRLLRLSPNKGLLYTFQMSSAAPFQLFLDDSSLYIGPWGRTSPYLEAKDFGTTVQEASPV